MFFSYFYSTLCPVELYLKSVTSCSATSLYVAVSWFMIIEYTFLDRTRSPLALLPVYDLILGVLPTVSVDVENFLL